MVEPTGVEPYVLKDSDPYLNALEKVWPTEAKTGMWTLSATPMLCYRTILNVVSMAFIKSLHSLIVPTAYVAIILNGVSRQTNIVIVAVMS